MNFNIISPNTSEELLDVISQNQNSNYRFGAGYTDLILELKKQQENDLTVINLAQLEDEQFIRIKRIESGIRIGALVTAGQIVANKEIQKEYPVLHEAANELASMQIRQVATVGGNLCTASPSGDIACALMALEAQCEILNTKGKIRNVPLTQFFTDVRKTVIQKDEILKSVIIPPLLWEGDGVSPFLGEMSEGQKREFSHFIKIGTRRSMECSVVSLAYHILTDEDENVTKARIAIGSVAPTIKFTTSACDYLAGKSLSEMTEKEKEIFANKVLEYASPISDIRGSAWYRKEVLFNISKSIFEN